MKRVIFTALLVFTCLQVLFRDFNLTYYENSSISFPELFYLPSSKHIKPFVLGYNHIAADMIWIKTISYFADQFVGGQDYRYLEKLLYIINDLDPMFEKVLLWGGSVLIYNGMWITEERIQRSTDFLKYGWEKIKNADLKYRHDREYWRIPHMIGFNYAIELRDIKKGLPYIEEVAKIPQAPSFYKTWVSTLHKRAGEKENAVKSLERELIIENLRTALSQEIDESLRKQIIGRLKKYYTELYDEEFAKKRLDELIKQSIELRKLYVSNFPYISRELFFILQADKFITQRNPKLIDRFFYDELWYNPGL
jgi:hypothetical protein